MEFTTTELEQIALNLSGFSSELMTNVVDKIAAELARREEVERLNFDDCESCKL